MEGEWEEKTLADVSAGVAYGYTESASDEKVGPRFLRITDIQNGVVDWHTVPFCPISDSDHQKYRLHSGDIVVARTGNSTGENYLYRGNEDAVYASYLIRFRINQRAANPAFVWYHMRTQRWQEFINRSKTGSAQAGANAKVLGLFPLTLPPLAEQKAIAAVLGALDDKIELNRKMNATLEAMARALFKSWFVDFDPVRTKLDGRKPEGLDGATAALFPDSFQDSVLGQIPKGWEISALGSILDVLETGRRPKGGVSSYKSGIPSIGAESINGIGVFDYSKTKFIPPEFFEKTLSGRIAHFDVLLYKDGGKPGEFKPRVGMYGHEFPFKTFCINEHVFRMRSTKTGQSFLYFTVSDQRVLSDFANKGGKAAIPGINQPDVKATPIVLPPKGITDAFNARADILCDQILCNAKQSRTLATLRDALLPNLLSGDLSVDKIKERLVA